MTKQECDKMKFNIPKYEIEALARAFLPAVLNYYRTEEGKKDLKSKKENVENSKLLDNQETAKSYFYSMSEAE